VNTENSDQARWFAEHVQPHEPTLRAWLHSRFPQSAEREDIMQEAFARVWQARLRGELRAPKAFLFATARNLALDLVRRQNVLCAEPLKYFDEADILDETAGVPETVARNQELALLTEAIQALPDRCRQIFTLRKIYGLPQAEIAARLGVSEHTVSAQLTIGLHKCTGFFTRHCDTTEGRR
jgi:RNA polymerase sigma-70 factor (ECF subfamily)